VADALDAIVDAGLEKLSRGELEAGYRAVCAMVLYRTAVVASNPAPPRRQEIDAKVTAKRWLAGDRGVITFPEACSAVDIDPDIARRKIEVYADPDSPSAISRRRRKPRNHFVFGRKATDVGHRPLPPGQDPPAR
jgi:hypothetical protein